MSRLDICQHLTSKKAYIYTIFFRLYDKSSHRAKKLIHYQKITEDKPS